jgi:hypothetical protein
MTRNAAPRAAFALVIALAAAAPAGAVVVEHLISENNHTSEENPQLYFNLITGEVSHEALGTEHYLINNFDLLASSIYAREDYATVGVFFDDPAYWIEAVEEGVNVDTLEFREPPIGNPMGVTAYLHIPGQPGPWDPVPRRAFAGLRFLIDGNVHYGWAEITVDADESLTIHRLGYETEAETGLATPPFTTASEAITWGETKAHY